MNLLPILADISTVNPVTLKDLVVILFGALGAASVVVSWVRKPTTTISPQPLTVEVVKALHEQFADRDEFIELKEHTTARHGQLFSAINKVEREAREAMDKRFETLNVNRTEQIEKLNQQFTFIRETIVAIQTELKIRNRNPR